MSARGDQVLYRQRDGHRLQNKSSNRKRLQRKRKITASAENSTRAFWRGLISYQQNNWL